MLPFLWTWSRILLVSDILKIMDQSADPCQDFYQFTCGNYGKWIKLGEDESQIDRFTEIQKIVNSQLNIVLQQPIQPNESIPFRLAKVHYQSCMNVTELEILGLGPWKTLITNAGGWPILMGNNWTETNYNWMSALTRFLRDYGISSILSIYVGSDPRETSKRILKIDQTGLGLGTRDYYLSKEYNPILSAYKEYMLDTAILLGAEKTIAEKDVMDVINLEINLANISSSMADRMNHSGIHNILSIGQLKKQFPKIPFNQLFDDIAAYGWNFTDAVESDVVDRPFLEALPAVLEQTKKRTLANYQMWTVAVYFDSYIAQSLKNQKRKFRETMYGAKKDLERWRQCVINVGYDMSQVVDSMYVKEYFKPEERAQLEEMLDDIQVAMENVLFHSPWMDNQTRKAALKKIWYLIGNLGYPSYLVDEGFLEKTYDGLEFNESTYMENGIQLAGIVFNRSMISLMYLVDRRDWSMRASSVNAAYSMYHNTITFPAAILQYPFFMPYAPANVNYGRIGFIIGHEITHGYDIQGRQFGPQGNLMSWWTYETSEDYYNRSQCFIEQYGNITDKITGYKLNGELELGENIADNGGVKLAYQAYQIWRKPSGVMDNDLEGLAEYSPDQLFFISLGQVYCETARKEYLADLIATDAHAPNRYRVNVPLSNFDKFSEAFNCSLGTPMNPEKKCSVW